ncbi:MAG: hypothetical protein E6H10_07530 [Bacteroidetes bacterium]|nr:MAG: hypothetical protein E6H10_07530 [Bacteroidota bacterium]
MPSTYVVKLFVDGKTFTQSLTVKMDPRVKTPYRDLQLQHDLSLVAYNSRKQLLQIGREISVLQSNIKDTTTIAVLNKFVSGERGSKEVNFNQVVGSLDNLLDLLQESDMPPTAQMISTMKEAQIQFTDLLKKWNEFRQRQ